MGTTEGKSHDMKHIRLHWLHTFRVYLVEIMFGCIDIIYVPIDTVAMSDVVLSEPIRRRFA